MLAIHVPALIAIAHPGASARVRTRALTVDASTADLGELVRPE
jgi:hypothetical protein